MAKESQNSYPYYETGKQIVETIENNKKNKKSEIVALTGKYGTGKSHLIRNIIKEEKIKIIHIDEDAFLKPSRRIENKVNYFGLVKTKGNLKSKRNFLKYWAWILLLKFCDFSLEIYRSLRLKVFNIIASLSTLTLAILSESNGTNNSIFSNASWIFWLVLSLFLVPMISNVSWFIKRKCSIKANDAIVFDNLDRLDYDHFLEVLDYSFELKNHLEKTIILVFDFDNIETAYKEKYSIDLEKEDQLEFYFEKYLDRKFSIDPMNLIIEHRENIFETIKNGFPAEVNSKSIDLARRMNEINRVKEIIVNDPWFFSNLRALRRTIENYLQFDFHFIRNVEDGKFKVGGLWDLYKVDLNIFLTWLLRIRFLKEWNQKNWNFFKNRDLGMTKKLKDPKFLKENNISEKGAERMYKDNVSFGVSGKYIRVQNARDEEIYLKEFYLLLNHKDEYWKAENNEASFYLFTGWSNRFGSKPILNFLKRSIIYYFFEFENKFVEKFMDTLDEIYEIENDEQSKIENYINRFVRFSKDSLSNNWKTDILKPFLYITLHKKIEQDLNVYKIKDLNIIGIIEKINTEFSEYWENVNDGKRFDRLVIWKLVRMLILLIESIGHHQKSGIVNEYWFSLSTSLKIIWFWIYLDSNFLHNEFLITKSIIHSQSLISNWIFHDVLKNGKPYNGPKKPEESPVIFRIPRKYDSVASRIPQAGINTKDNSINKEYEINGKAWRDNENANLLFYMKIVRDYWNDEYKDAISNLINLFVDEGSKILENEGNPNFKNDSFLYFIKTMILFFSDTEKNTKNKLLDVYKKENEGNNKKKDVRFVCNQGLLKYLELIRDEDNKIKQNDIFYWLTEKLFESNKEDLYLFFKDATIVDAENEMKKAKKHYLERS